MTTNFYKYLYIIKNNNNQNIFNFTYITPITATVDHHNLFNENPVIYKTKLKCDLAQTFYFKFLYKNLQRVLTKNLKYFFFFY